MFNQLCFKTANFISNILMFVKPQRESLADLIDFIAWERWVGIAMASTLVFMAIFAIDFIAFVLALAAEHMRSTVSIASYLFIPLLAMMLSCLLWAKLEIRTAFNLILYKLFFFFFWEIINTSRAKPKLSRNPFNSEHNEIFSEILLYMIALTTTECLIIKTQKILIAL